jgi:hypothetical protein
VRPTTGYAGSATWRLVATNAGPPSIRSSSVYDMYPDTWGPAKHRTPFEPTYEQESRGHEALQASLDRRDNGGQRPDDN